MLAKHMLHASITDHALQNKETKLIAEQTIPSIAQGSEKLTTLLTELTVLPSLIASSPKLTVLASLTKTWSVQI